jgi:hypothetical protein
LQKDLFIRFWIAWRLTTSLFSMLNVRESRE